MFARPWRKPGTSALFDAAFRYEDVLIRVNILVRLPGGGWRLCEVKSRSDLEEAYLPDVPIYDGIALDPDSLFRSHPATDETDELQEIVSTRIKEMLATLGRPASADIALPVVVPGNGFGDFEIRDQNTATAKYTQALSSTALDERQRMLKSLRAYCHCDTLAIMRLRYALLATTAHLRS